MDRLKLYQQVTECPLHCDGIVNDPARGIIPRSFYYTDARRSVPLLIVSKNPAHAPEWERKMYLRTPRAEWAKKHLEFVQGLFEGTESVPTSYHANLIRRVAAVLGVEATASAVFRDAAMTALVKCQLMHDASNKLASSTIQTCAERFLAREINSFNPVYLLALGREVYEYLLKSDVVRARGLRVGKLWHPSWSNMPGGKANYFKAELPRLHAEYISCLKS